jgi:plastocyanin
MNAKRPTIVALAAVAVFGIAGCGSASNSPSSDPGPTTPSHSMAMTASPTSASPPSASSSSTSSDDSMAGMVMIDIKDFMYSDAMSVKARQLVMVTNDDSEAHTVTSDQTGMFAVTVQPGETATFHAPSTSGSYAYHCDFHANMHGSLVVT